TGVQTCALPIATLYQELHTMARRQLAGQHGQTLDATALVHEAYLKLIGRREAKFDDRAHFFAYAASAMRSVVVDYARQRLAQKRGGDLHRVTELPEEIEGGLRLDEDMLGLDTALTQLAAVDERLARVVELRYFAGLSEMEIAALLDRSARSIRRDWQKAKLFLLAALQGDEDGGPQEQDAVARHPARREGPAVVEIRPQARAPLRPRRAARGAGRLTPSGRRTLATAVPAARRAARAGSADARAQPIRSNCGESV